MAQTKKANIKELIQDDKNFNRHSEYGMSLLEKSVSKFGMGRSILLDKNNKMIFWASSRAEAAVKFIFNEEGVN